MDFSFVFFSKQKDQPDIFVYKTITIFLSPQSYWVCDIKNILMDKNRFFRFVLWSIFYGSLETIEPECFFLIQQHIRIFLARVVLQVFFSSFEMQTPRRTFDMMGSLIRRAPYFRTKEFKFSIRIFNIITSSSKLHPRLNLNCGFFEQNFPIHPDSSQSAISFQEFPCRAKSIKKAPSHTKIHSQ